MANIPRPTSRVHLPNLEKWATVVYIYQSAGFTGDGGGSALIVGTDKNGEQVVKKIHVGPGPDDPGYRVSAALAEVLAEPEVAAKV